MEAFVQNKIRDIAYEAIAKKGEHEKIGLKSPISMPENRSFHYGQKISVYAYRIIKKDLYVCT